MTTSSWRLPLAAVIVVLGRHGRGSHTDAAPDGHRRSAQPPAAERPAAVARRQATCSTRRADADWKSGRRVSHIWRAPSTAAQPVQLTSGADGENDPRWSPDGKTIAFTAKRGDDEFAQIYLLPVDGGEARRLTTHASAVSELTWAPDGVVDILQGAEAKTADEKAREKARDDVYAVRRELQADARLEGRRSRRRPRAGSPTATSP